MADKTLDDMLIEEQGAQDANKPRPFTVWNVGENEYKLKLQASIITTLERKFNKSLLLAVLDEGLPPVQVTLDVIQGALQKYHHGMNASKVEKMYDAYIEEGHTQYDVLHDVLFPLLSDAGFFTTEQLAELQNDVTKMSTTL